MLLLQKGLTGDFKESCFHESAHWGWACFESGFLSGLLYLFGTALYVVAIPYTDPAATPPDLVKASWLWLGAALVFIVEAVIDVLDALWIRRAKAVEGSLLAQEFAVVENGEVHCMRWLDDIDFRLWQSVFFLLPSALYVVECFLDPNVVVVSRLNLMRSEGWSCPDFATAVDHTASCLFLVGSFVSIAGRYVAIRQTARENSLVVFQVWKAEHFFDVNWSAYGDGLFVIGSVFAVHCSFTPDRTVEITSDVLWLVDAVLYMFGSTPLLCATRRARKKASAPTTGPWQKIQRLESRQSLRKHWSSHSLWGPDFNGE